MGAPSKKNIRVTNTVRHSPGSKTLRLGAPNKVEPDDLLPGVDWLGYGYRPFGPMIDSDWTSRENLFQFPESPDQFSFLGRPYKKPALITGSLLMENQAKFHRITQRSVKDTITQIYGEMMAGASQGLFKGEFELSYSNSLEKHWEYRSAAIQMILRLLRLTLPTQMRPYLKPDVATELENAAEDAEAKAAGRAMPHGTDFTRFFGRWGTHYISGLHVGGSYNLYMKFLSSGYKSVEELNAKVSAAYGCLSASSQAKISESIDALDESEELFITAYGGLEVPTDWSQLASFEKAVLANPGPISFYGDKMQGLQGLTPVYTLVSEPARQEALKSEWKAYCDSNALVLPKLGTVVTAIQVVADPDGKRARDKARAGGFEVIDVDLNKGAGGEFIFVGKKFGDAETGTERPLLNLVGIEGDSSSIPAPPGYQKYPTDVNKGAKGRFIYLCSTSDASANELLVPIRDITAESSKGSLTAEYFTKKGWTVVSRPGEQDPLDLNLLRLV